MFDKIIKLMRAYQEQAGYPLAQTAIIYRIEREAERLTNYYPNIRPAISHLLFDFD